MDIHIHINVYIYLMVSMTVCLDSPEHRNPPPLRWAPGRNFSLRCTHYDQHDQNFFTLGPMRMLYMWLHFGHCVVIPRVRCKLYMRTLHPEIYCTLVRCSANLNEMNCHRGSPTPNDSLYSLLHASPFSSRYTLTESATSKHEKILVRLNSWISK